MPQDAFTLSQSAKELNKLLTSSQLEIAREELSIAKSF